MSARTGRLGGITYAKESAWGNGASVPTHVLRAGSEGLKHTPDHVEDPALVNEINPTNFIKVGEGIAGPIDGAMHPDEVGNMLYGVLGNEASVVSNPIKAMVLVGYSGSDTYLRMTKSGSTLTAEKSANGSSWTPDTNFASTAGAIDVTAGAYDTLTKLAAYIAARTGYDAVIFGDSCDSSTIADFTATKLRDADIDQGALIMKVQPTSSVAKTHSLTHASGDSGLPSWMFLIDRVLGTNKSVSAVGSKINSITISNSAKDLVKMTLNITAKRELTDQTDAALAIPTVEAYITPNVKIVLQQYNGELIEFDETKEFSITINANIDDNRVVGSFYKSEQERGKGSVEATFTAANTSEQYAAREDFEDDKPVGIFLYFKGNEYADTPNLVPYNAMIRVPAMKMTDFNSPLSTQDRLVITGAAKAVKPASAVYPKHLYAEVVDQITSVY